MSIFALFYELIGVLIGTAAMWTAIMVLKGIFHFLFAPRRDYSKRDPNQPHCRFNPAPGHRR
jgi:hypothetical protein